MLSASGGALVSGTYRFKYFKRPVMPKVSAVPPQILLAPTAAENNPLIPIIVKAEPPVKDAEVQTMYRESEAQTNPYSPEFIIPVGQDPELLLLKNVTYDKGLPLGRKEIEIIEFARAKRLLENSLPPFTDEASLIQRKRLMEQQEMKEFKLREGEIDHKREEKLKAIEKALIDREESNEFMASQKLEGIRLMRIEEREKVLQKIRHKRIKALRLLAHQRNLSDPILSDGTGRDIISDYFDKGSSVYAPIKRDGIPGGSESIRYDVGSRTLPLDTINNINNIEYSLPKSLMEQNTPINISALMSKTSPGGAILPALGVGMGGGRAAEPRLTSAAQRSLSMTKRDVEEMHQILMQRKLKTNSAILQNKLNASGASTPPRTGSAPLANETMNLSKIDLHVDKSAVRNNILSALLAKKPKGRPPTPDLTVDRTVIRKPLRSATSRERRVINPYPNSANDHEFQMAVTILQKLVRGRALQNIMFEGLHRRKELLKVYEAERAERIAAGLDDELDGNGGREGDDEDFLNNLMGNDDAAEEHQEGGEGEEGRGEGNQQVNETVPAEQEQHNEEIQYPQ